MISTLQNTNTKQKDAERAIVVAVMASAVFESPANEEEVWRVGVALPLVQALQKVNKCLLEKNPTESLFFDIILITTNKQQQQQSSQFINSIRQYGLEVSKFCFSSEEDLMENVLKNKVQLFLTTDRKEALQASQKGVLSAVLDQQTASCPTDQLRVLLCGDTITKSDTGPTPSSQQAAQRFSGRLGEMRRKLALFDSPLSIILVNSCGGRESCGWELRTLRSSGISVDEVYCLAGAPRGPIMSIVRPHFILSDLFCKTEE